MRYENNMKNYWTELYKKFNDMSPSTFAVFCGTYICKDDTVLDLGCGNGRDAYYFAKKAKRVIGIDKNNCPKSSLFNLRFQLKDISSLMNSNIKNETIDIIYLRFLFHCIDNRLKNQLLRWCYNSLIDNGLLMIENRDQGDKPLNLFGEHDRFLIDSSDFLMSVLGVGFKLIYFIKDKNLSPFRRENPLLFRIVAKK